MNLRRWLHEHSLKLLAIRDTPEAIAGGIAIGIFFGFTPLFGIKTVSAIFFAWLLRCNIIAAVLAGTLHDLVLPIMPVVFVWEYKIGFWMLNGVIPRGVPRIHLAIHEWRDWTRIFTSQVGKPMLLGSVIVSLPTSLICYFIAKFLVARHRKKHPHPPEMPVDTAQPE